MMPESSSGLSRDAGADQTASCKETTMNTSKHLSVIAGANHGNESQSTPRLPRDVVMAVIVSAVLLAGIGAGAAFSPDSGTHAVATQAVASQPSQEFVYFPSQYVNQGTEIPEPTPTF
jgi:hypothetical protein